MDTRFDHINSIQKQKQAFEYQLKKQKERNETLKELQHVGVIFGVGFIFGLLFNVIFF